MYNVRLKEISEMKYKYQDNNVAEVYLTMRKNNWTIEKLPLQWGEKTLVMVYTCCTEGNTLRAGFSSKLE